MISDLDHKKRTILIRTPDQRLRVFVSSTLKELAAERKAVHQAITRLHLSPVMFEMGARPHPAQDLYHAYLSQSHVFIGLYWQSYGWIGPGMQISGLEDEYNRSAGKPRLIYIKNPAPDREAGLQHMLDRIREENKSSYKYFESLEELKNQVEDDLILLLTEYFETARAEEQFSEQLALGALTNVPIPRNPIIGREYELKTARNLLLQDDVGLLTFTGTAGTGKSRLAIQIALDLREHFTDGVYMVLLESIRDSTLVIPTIASTLKISETINDLSILDELKHHLCHKQMFLVLDNFEQVLPAAPQVAELLEACPRVKILVTSRASLHLRAEKELPVPPLKVPPLKEIPELRPFSQYSAVQLFVQRCQSVKADFQVTEENAQAIAEICNHLDGLPLAIELAAAWIKLLPPQALLIRLEQRFDILQGGMKDLPERHQTMYSAIEWSYSLLDESLKRLFQRLAVFYGGWTLDAAITVCSADNESQVEILNGLERLVDNNLLGSLEQSSGEPRLKMLESIREFAYERLKESGEEEIIHQNHARYYASLAEQADLEKFGSDRQLSWRLRLEAELDNLRAAMSWALENNEHACELRIATGLWRFWWTHGYWREGIQWLERGLAGREPSAGVVRARALTRLGWMLSKVGDIQNAIASLQESVSLWRQIDDQTGLAMALSNFGGILLTHDHDRATAMLEEALKIRRGLKNQRGVDATLMNLGLAMQRQGQTERAIELFTESLNLARKVRDYYSMGITLVNLGDTLTNQGNYELADGYFTEAEQIYTNMNDRSGLAEVKRGRGRIALKAGDYTRASELLSEACAVFYELGVKPLIIVTLECMAFVAGKENNSVKAIRLLSASDSLRQENRLVRIPDHQADCDMYLTSLRSSMDSDAYATAWNEGSLMTLDQVVTYAIQPGE